MAKSQPQKSELLIKKNVKRNFEFASPDKDINVETDWSLCFVCQEETNSELLKPYLKKGFDAGNFDKSSYSTLSKNLFDFKNLNSLPLSLERRIGDFLTCNDLTQTLAEKNAIYHKNCSSKYNQSHLERLKSKSEIASTITDTPRSSAMQKVAMRQYMIVKLCT